MTVVGGLDIGGTKMRLRVVDDSSGRELLDDNVDANGWTARSDASRAEELARLARERIAPFGAAAVVAGVRGCDSAAQKQLLGDALRSVVPAADVVNDSELVLPAAGVAKGTGVVAGTGASATSTDADGRPFMVGGWGWVLGDQGGATGIVRDAAQAVLAAWDAHVPDVLSPMLLHATGVRHPHGLGHLLSTVEPREWARHAHVVFDAAAAGSAAARGVLDANLDALVALLGTVRDRGGDISTVAAAGGVMTGQTSFFRQFSERVLAKHDETERVVILDTPPVEGALQLARALAEKESTA